MNEYTMELVDRFAALLEENAQLRAHLELLENTVKAAEIEDALYRERHKSEAWTDIEYKGNLTCEQINLIMGWKRSKEATEIIEGLKEERKNEQNS